MVNLVLQKLTNLAVVSNEVLEDEVFGLASWLTNDVGMSMVETEDTALYSTGTGSGDNEPDGFELDATSVGTAPVFFVPTGTQAADFALATLIDYAHLVKMFYALPERERMGAIWTGPSTIMQTLSTMLDLNGRPILAQANDEGRIVGDAEGGAMTRTLFGRPVIEMPGLEGTGQDSNRLYFVNMSRAYFMLEAGGIRVAATNEGGTAFSTDATHFRFIRRVDGQPSGNPIEAKPQYVYTGNITGAGTPV
jgi:HK97 family phage major capsid protein